MREVGVFYLVILHTGNTISHRTNTGFLSLLIGGRVYPGVLIELMVGVFVCV